MSGTVSMRSDLTHVPVSPYSANYSWDLALQLHNRDPITSDVIAQHGGLLTEVQKKAVLCVIARSGDLEALKNMWSYLKAMEPSKENEAIKEALHDATQKGQSQFVHAVLFEGTNVENLNYTIVLAASLDQVPVLEAIFSFALSKGITIDPDVIQHAYQEAVNWKKAKSAAYLRNMLPSQGGWWPRMRCHIS